MSVSYLTAVRSSDAENTRRRTDTLPPPVKPRWNERLGIAAAFFALGLGLGFLAGLGVL